MSTGGEKFFGRARGARLGHGTHGCPARCRGAHGRAARVEMYPTRVSNGTGGEGPRSGGSSGDTPLPAGPIARRGRARWGGTFFFEEGWGKLSRAGAAGTGAGVPCRGERGCGRRSRRGSLAVPEGRSSTCSPATIVEVGPGSGQSPSEPFSMEGSVGSWVEPGGRRDARETRRGMRRDLNERPAIAVSGRCAREGRRGGVRDGRTFPRAASGAVSSSSSRVVVILGGDAGGGFRGAGNGLARSGTSSSAASSSTPSGNRPSGRSPRSSSSPSRTEDVMPGPAERRPGLNNSPSFPTSARSFFLERGWGGCRVATRVCVPRPRSTRARARGERASRGYWSGPRLPSSGAASRARRRTSDNTAELS